MTDKNFGITRMKELIGILNDASKNYYNNDNESMSNYEYDKLYDELVSLEEETGVTMSDSPTVKVGYTVLSGLSKVTHDTKMLSLHKTKDVSKLKSFLGKQNGLLSWKLDGLTIVLKYNKGIIEKAITRGNGEVGEDVTHNAVFFKNLPHKITFQGELTVRGEAVISYTDFNRINESLTDEMKFKNPRNLCSGTVRQLNNEISSKRNVSFMAFSLVTADMSDFNDSKSEQIKWLMQQGFETVYYEKVNESTIEDAVNRFEDMISKNEYASDGLVLTFDSISYSESLGVTTKFPKDSIAFKWADEVNETVLKKIEWSASRTGLINPIAVFEPIELEGTTVTRAGLHNLSILESLELGIGDRITVYKANMIIPQIAENLTRSGNIEIPVECPECGGITQIVKLRDGKALKCINPNCMAKTVLALAHFASRDAMNIEGLSEATIEKLVDNGFIKNYTDLFKLQKYADKITALEGFGGKSYTNLISAVEKSKYRDLPSFIYALGIQNVGLSNSKLLCAHFNNEIDKIINAGKEQLLEIEGFGDIIAESIVNYFNNNKNISLLNEAYSFLKPTDTKKQPAKQTLAGLTFVITGDLFHFENRKQLQTEIENMGGKVTGSVTGKTSYLINNDIYSGSAKNKKAKELQIPIITEDRFLEISGEK